MHNSLTIALMQARETALTFFRSILKEYNLTEQQWRIIQILANIKAIDFHELSIKACILRPSLTGILSRMEREKLLFRLKPLNDQRKLYVSLAPKGQVLYEQASQRIDKEYQEIERRFSAKKLSALMVLLNEFIAIRDQPEVAISAIYEE